MSNIPDKLVDKRVIERNLAKGTLQEADVKKHYAALPDLTDAVDYTRVEDEFDDEDEDEEEEDDEPVAED